MRRRRAAARAAARRPIARRLWKPRKVYKYNLHTHNVAAMACWWGRRVRSKHIPHSRRRTTEKEQRTDVARAHFSESSKDRLHNNTRVVVLARGLAPTEERPRLGHAALAVAHELPAARGELLASLAELRREI